MGAVALTTSTDKSLRIVESIEQDTHPAAVDITLPAIVKLDSNGKWALAVAADTGTYLATRTVKAGQALTGLKRGVVDGINVSALAFGAKLYSNASSVPDTATSTGAQIVAEVISAHSNLLGTTADKLLRVNMP